MDSLNSIPDFFKTFLSSLSFALDADQTLQQFIAYKSFLTAYNQKINLISENDLNIIWSRHFFDSLVALSLFPEIFVQNIKMLDIGSGAGFPGFPLHILGNNSSLTCIDSVQKKCQFLSELQKELIVSRVTILPFRCEDLARQAEHRQQYNLVITRAAAHFSTALEYAAPFIKNEGHAIFWLGGNGVEALNAIQNPKNFETLKKLGVRFKQAKEYQIPNHSSSSMLLIVQKVKNSDPLYPRSPGTPKKKPLF